MSRFEPANGRFLFPTPGGAYAATLAPHDDPGRRVLLWLMSSDVSPMLTTDAAMRWSDASDSDAALEVLHRLQQKSLIQSEAAARHAATGALEDLLPELLRPLSSSGKALLADAQGFHLATAGFPREAAEELSALTADLATLQSRHARLLANNLGFVGGNWALVDAMGNSRIGAWPLWIGQERFALVIAGTPRLNQPAFVEMVWALTRRYANLRAGKSPH
jgi:hypothetical protein